MQKAAAINHPGKTDSSQAFENVLKLIFTDYFDFNKFIQNILKPVNSTKHLLRVCEIL